MLATNFLTLALIPFILVDSQLIGDYPGDGSGQPTRVSSHTEQDLEVVRLLGLARKNDGQSQNNNIHDTAILKNSSIAKNSVTTNSGMMSRKKRSVGQTLSHLTSALVGAGLGSLALAGGLRVEPVQTVQPEAD